MAAKQAWATSVPSLTGLPIISARDDSSRDLFLSLSPCARGWRRAQARRRVRGFVQLRRQTCQDSLQILKHIVVPEAHHTKLIFDEPIVAFDISNRIGVLTAVNLDDQSRFEKEKVRDIS